jgi:response regulator RpfG family c-di-GMP phosphodiesterase
MTYKILIVDDEAANLRILERLFASSFEVFTAASGEDGLKVLISHDIALIISDQRMPGMTGVNFLKKAAELRASTVRMILTGYTDIDALVESINSGVVYRYITKPWSNPDLQQTVKRALDFYEVQKKRHALEQENIRMQHRAKATLRGYINLALEMLDIKSPRISDHARRTAKYAGALGKALNLTEPELEQLFLAAVLHEVAHVRLPAHLMSRTTLLRDGEFKLMQENFRDGIKLLATVPDLEDVAAVIDFHHDHWDGNGSINRLCGEQIPLDARIIAITDSYDEMREPSNSTRGLSHDAAVAVLRSAAGRKFDPSLVAVFCGLKLSDDAIPSPRSVSDLQGAFA